MEVLQVQEDKLVSCKSYSFEWLAVLYRESQDINFVIFF